MEDGGSVIFILESKGRELRRVALK